MSHWLRSENSEWWPPWALWYCRVHMTLKSTPAVAAGLATETWTIERLLTEAAKVEREYVTLN